MTKTTSNSTVKPSIENTDAEPDHDDVELFEGTEFVSLPEGFEKEEATKRDARRKIEIYWEKKQLKEQFEDFDESEFGF
jgi:hypothetical protein